jgi:hypothetical protein
VELAAGRIRDRGTAAEQASVTDQAGSRKNRPETAMGAGDGCYDIVAIR